jgi:hypothetical protein
MSAQRELEATAQCHGGDCGNGGDLQAGEALEGGSELFEELFGSGEMCMC